MKKKVLMKVFLVLLPAMAVLLATTGDSVTVYDIPAATVRFYSYFALVPGTNLQMCAPLAAILAVAALVLALIYIATGKQWCVNGVFYCGAVSTFAATLPIVNRGDIIVVPNVILPILMTALCFLAHKAKNQPKEKPVGIRLKNRK